MLPGLVYVGKMEPGHSKQSNGILKDAFCIASQVLPHTYITFRCPYFLPLAALHLEHAVSEYLLSTDMQYNVIGTPEGIHVNMTILGLSHHSY